MITTVHTIAGGIVGEKVNNPLFAFFAGIALHYILDAIPHFDNVLENKLWTWKQWVFTSVDLIITALLLIYLKPELVVANPFIWGAIGGMLPDLLEHVPFWGKQFISNPIGKRLSNFHEKIHIQKQSGVVIGMLTQVIILAIILIIR